MADISIPQRERSTPVKKTNCSTDPRFGITLSHVIEISRGRPVKYQTNPRIMIRPPGMNEPKMTPKVLIQLEIFIPIKFAKVAHQKATKIIERVYIVLFEREGSKI